MAHLLRKPIQAIPSLALLSTLLSACLHPATEHPNRQFDLRPLEIGPPGLSARVQEEILRYPTDGSYGYHWPPDDGIWWGTTRAVWYRGDLLSPGDPEHRSHCVGLTWEVAMAVLSEAAGGVDQPINGLSTAQMEGFRADWFVRELRGRGAADAVERYGVGISVPMEAAQPGDFLQIWFGAMSGHSAIFQGWIYRSGRVTGVRYWSTYPTTGGIGYQEAPIGPAGIDPALFFVARLMPASAWHPPEPG